jgi:hypothetical protein
VITRQDIPFIPAQVSIVLRQELNVFAGPLELVKRVVVLEDGLEIVLEIRSSEALKNVVIKDILPSEARLTSPAVFKNGETVLADGSMFSLGDIPAGFSTSLSYGVSFADAPALLLIAPEFSWELR